MDAEDYSKLPKLQWEEDNVLRELNKCLLAFQQTPMKSKDRHERRLSPIGKSQPDKNHTFLFYYLVTYIRTPKLSSYKC